MNLAFIPVRCGSKSIPLKNIKKFCGRPLVFWNVEALQNAKNIDKIVVATDCDKIKETVRGFGFDKVEIYDRESGNANDTSSTESVMLEYLNKRPMADDDLFFLVQATSPMTLTEDFENAEKKLKSEKADSLLTCVRTKRFFWNEDGTPVNYDYRHRPRRQDFDGMLMENGAFYINTVCNILRDRNRLSGKIAVYEMPEYTAVEIDEEDDWHQAERLMYKYVLSKRPKKSIKLFLSDVDGVLTDAGMYYSENGDELKKFNTHDGKAFELLRNAGIKTGLITSENTKIVERRAKKLKIDHLYQGKEHGGKLEAAKKICEVEGVTLEETAYIGDDINCKELLESVGFAACPADAVDDIKRIPNIIVLTQKGGNGAVREFVEILQQH